MTHETPSDANTENEPQFKPTKKTVTRTFGIKLTIPWILKGYFSEKWFTELKADKDKKK